MSPEQWLPVAQDWLTILATWVRSLAPAQLQSLPDWALLLLLLVVVVGVVSLVGQLIEAVLRPIVRLVQLLAFLMLGAAAFLYVARTLGWL